MRKSNRKINLIVIHCSATRVDKDYTPEQLERDHKARGFNSAGYNYYIRKNGEVVPMRPLELIPAHLNGDGKITPNEWTKMCPCFDAEEEYKNI